MSAENPTVVQQPVMSRGEMAVRARAPVAQLALCVYESTPEGGFQLNENMSQPATYTY